MPAALRHAGSRASSVTPRSDRVGTRMVRPAALFIGGLAIAFSGGLHSELTFDRLLTGVVLVIFAASQLFDWRAAPEGARVRVSLVAAALALVAAALQIMAVTPSLFAAVLAAWGITTGVCDFITGRALPKQRGDYTFLAVIAIVMAALVLAFANDQIAVIGFFGAYAVIAGVFIGISVFDAHSKAKREAELAATEAGAAESGLESTAGVEGVIANGDTTPANRSESAT